MNKAVGAESWERSTSTPGKRKLKGNVFSKPRHPFFPFRLNPRRLTGLFFCSHEGLILGYEEALTRSLPVPSSLRSAVRNASAGEAHGNSALPHAYYNTSAHFIWIGDRTRQIDGAHVEYFRGIRNPIGIKVGPSMKGEELVRLLGSECILLAAFAVLLPSPVGLSETFDIVANSCVRSVAPSCQP